MKAARVYKPGEIVIEEVPIPEIGQKDVLIKVHRAGICGTDVGIVRGKIVARWPCSESWYPPAGWDTGRPGVPTDSKGTRR